MIVTRIENLKRYKELNENFKKLTDYLLVNDLSKINEGEIKIDGENVFGNCFVYYADGKEGDFFETHMNYLDVHIVIENAEDMAISSRDSTRVVDEYDEKKDIEILEGTTEQLIHLTSGTCLITFPEDLHQPKVKVNNYQVKKAVFKVRL